MLEYATNYSVGRGTDAPFEQAGAAFIRGPELAAWLDKRFIPGVRVYPTRFTPASSNLAGQSIEGLRFVITQREAFDSARLGIELAAALLKLYPGQIGLSACRRLIGSDALIRGLESGEDPRALVERHSAEVQTFLPLRAKYLIYK